jgi:predicted transcriptional regulator
MLEAVVGSRAAERVLIFMAARGKGYAKEIADTFDMNATQIQKQLNRMERDGLFVSQAVGRARVYEMNPRFLFTEELNALLMRVLEKYPARLREQLLMDRRRPRRKGKPL